MLEWTQRLNLALKAGRVWSAIGLQSVSEAPGSWLCYQEGVLRDSQGAKASMHRAVSFFLCSYLCCHVEGKPSPFR